MTLDPSKHYLFYDGDCGLCNYWVQWILRHDTKDSFLFAPLQGELGQKFLKERRLPTEKLDSIYLWKPEKYYLHKSAAILKCMEILGGGYALLAKMNFLPKAFTDALYSLVAANRKKFGAAQCTVPSAEDRAKFLS